MEDWNAEADPQRLRHTVERRVSGRQAPDPEALDGLARTLSAAANPVLVAGPEIDAAGGWDAAVALAERQRLPVVLFAEGGGGRPGDTDVTGRVPNVVFGIILIALPYFFRKWLGRRGWVVTSLLLLISPVVTYYSRFNRHDIYVEVFVILMLLAIMKYFETRADRWLYAGAAILAFSFTAMETTFIFTALFAYVLTAIFTYEWFNRNKPDFLRGYHGILAAV